MNRRAEISASGYQLEAAVVADVFRISPREIMSHIRDGRLTTLCEQGVDDDLGRHRLTFYLGNRHARFVIDEDGRVLHSLRRFWRPAPAAETKGSRRQIAPDYSGFHYRPN